MTLLQNQYVFSKATNKIFIYIWAPFILQNFLKILRANPELRGCAIFKPKIAHLSYKKFFGTLLLLSSTYCPFSLCKILKNSCSRFRVMKMFHFWVKNGPFVPNKTFLGGELLILFSSTYWPLSLCKFFKKFLQRIQSYEDGQFLGPKWRIYPKVRY